MRFLVGCRGYARAATRHPNHGILRHTQNDLVSSGDGGYKLRTLRTAIDAIECTHTKIKSKADAEAIKSVGATTAQVVADHLNSEAQKLDPQTEQVRKKAKAILQQVPGIGIAKADKLISEGCYSIAHLRRPEYTELLTPVQKINLKYFEHLQRPVQRVESELVADFIRSSLSSEFEVILTGSYRRGFPISSSITLMLLHPSYVHIPYPDVSSPFSEAAKEKSARRGRVQVAFRESFTKMAAKSQSLLVSQIIPCLEERGLLADTVSIGTKKWIGIVRVPEVDDEGVDSNAIMARRKRRDKIRKMQGGYRKLEINLVPQKSRAAALLALTGDIEFNRDMRLRANKMGMHLDEFGLWRWNSLEPSSSSLSSEPMLPSPPPAESASEPTSAPSLLPTLVPTPTEESIFEELGIPYIPPEKRNFSYLVSVGKRNTDRPQRMDRVVRAAGGR
ncbi:hypothetical protein VKT23_003459 [Stygiomarasmius scandens]|uniref:DNA-directed DNA polymerase X domain-containing protein n=1 Tax=Marasmiellus scandens TaxID=2682957 RepID=A0ABR1JXZ5_9AGAR